MRTCGGCPHPQSVHLRADGCCTILHCGCTWREPTAEYPLMLPTSEAALCMDCGRPLPPGAPYTERLTGMCGDIPVVEVICVYC